MDLLNFEEHEKYMKELERYNKRESIHHESAVRNRKKNNWEKYKKLKYGRKPIG